VVSGHGEAKQESAWIKGALGHIPNVENSLTFPFAVLILQMEIEKQWKK
jgi:hypothetical protein